MNGLKKLFSRSNLPVLFLGGVLFLGALFWYMAAGAQNDDFFYLHEFTGREPYSVEFNYCEGSEITTFRQVIDSIHLHYFYWGNARLGSALIFLANLWPRWFTEMLDAVALTAMFLLTLRLGLGRGWQRRPLACMLMCAAIWWFLPWHEFMLASTFALNYVGGAALSLWLLLLLLTGRGKTWAVSLLACVAGMMHEGLSLTMCVALFCWCVMKLLRRGWQGHFMWPSICYALGSLFVTLSPAVFLRSSDGNIFHHIWLFGLVHALIIRWPMLTITALSAPLAAWLLPRRRFRLWWRFTWPVLVGTFVSAMVVFLVYDNMLRGAWLGILLCIVSMARLLRGVHLPRGKGWQIAGKSLAASLLVLMAAWMGAVGVLQQRLTAEMRLVADRYVSSRSPLVYADTTDPEHLPWWALDIPITVHESILGLSYHTYATRLRSSLPDLPYDFRQVALLAERDSLTPLTQLPAIPGTAQLHPTSGATMYSPLRLGQWSQMLMGDPRTPQGERATRGRVRFPWWRLRQSFQKEIRSDRHIVLYQKPILVTPEIRRRHSIPQGLDTIYLYELEWFTIPFASFGLPIERIDTLPKNTIN